MTAYELTRDAEADLRGITRYTLRAWGERQALRYASLLEACFQSIAGGSAVSRPFSETYPQVRVTRCEHRYIFYLSPEGQRPRISAVPHAHMDLLAKIRDRLP